LVIVALAACGSREVSNSERIERLLTLGKDVTILATDSGLGGMDITADLAARMERSGVFRRARIVFFSALFKERSGYNSLVKEADQLGIFDIVLAAMEEKYRPDLLLIGCNTLSVLYDKTAFARKPAFPVVGIVDAGIELIARQFDQTPGATALLFATRTTIDSHAHKAALAGRGIPEDRVVEQVCDKLAGAVDRGPGSPETVAMIRNFVAQALAKRPDPTTPVFASLNCTDYPLALEQFREALAAAGQPGIPVLNPNARLSDFLFQPRFAGRFPSTEVTVEVVSKTVIENEMLEAVGAILRRIHPATSEAFLAYRHDPHLFEVDLDRVEFIRSK